MGPETQAYITGTFAGQKVALMILVKLLHKSGAINASEYIDGLKATYNQPNAKFDRPDYDYLRGLAASLEKEMDGR